MKNTLAFVAALLLVAGCKPAAETETRANAVATPAPAATVATKSVVGQEIRFTTGGNSEHYRVSGWSKTEPQFTWTEGTVAKLSLPIGKPQGALKLVVMAAGFVKEPELPAQEVQVYANGEQVAEWQVGTTEVVTATIPADVASRSETLALEFRTPKAASPEQLGTAPDKRVIGLAVYHVTLSNAP
jgi:hypothetical protein